MRPWKKKVLQHIWHAPSPLFGRFAKKKSSRESNTIQSSKSVSKSYLKSAHKHEGKVKPPPPPLFRAMPIFRLQYVPEGSASWKYNNYFPVAEGAGKILDID